MSLSIQQEIVIYKEQLSESYFFSSDHPLDSILVHIQKLSMKELKETRKILSVFECWYILSDHINSHRIDHVTGLSSQESNPSVMAWATIKDQVRHMLQGAEGLLLPFVYNCLIYFGV